MGKSGHLGELEQMVLLAVLRLGDDDAYGSRVRDELQAKADRGVARGALYVTLDRLVEKGMLDTRVGDPTPGRGGRPRRYLTVTPAGITALRRARQALTNLWDGLDAVTDQG